MALNLRVLVSLVVALMIILNFNSAFLRHAKSGLECDDRPVCYQQVGSSGEPMLFIESEENWRYHFATNPHRLLASVIAILVLVINVKLFRRGRGESPSKARRYAMAMGGAILWLAGLGIAAGGSLALPVVMGNLLGGLILLLLSVLLLASLLGWKFEVAPGRLILVAGGVLLLTLFLQGGVVSASFSGMACTVLPDCNGRWWSGNPLIQAHMMHRFSVVVALLYFGMLLWRALKEQLVQQRNLLLLLLFLLLVQMQLGVIMVEQQLPLLITSLHSILAQLLIIVLMLQLLSTDADANHSAEIDHHG